MENKKRKNFYGYFGKSKSTYTIGEEEKKYYLERPGPRPVSIGNEFFREIREKNYFYIDKSLYIKNIIDDASKVILITRPRRFGKTLNMDMLKCFFNIEEDSREIFKGLKIMEQGENYTNYLNSMPVIYLTLKDVMGGSFETMIALLKTCISNMYKQHNNLLDNKKLRTQQRERVRKYIDKEMEKEELLSSINELAELLESVYGKKVLLLLDEYDVPLQNAYVSGFYGEAIEYLKIFYANSFKGNAYIEKAVLTGVSRVSKETIFS
ncbi:MAG: AAA family ATPase, partial [Clostridia bacterium]|nr:AAA family ATPase [Clostridia bacterium]